MLLPIVLFSESLEIYHIDNAKVFRHSIERLASSITIRYIVSHAGNYLIIAMQYEKMPAQQEVRDGGAH